MLLRLYRVLPLLALILCISANAQTFNGVVVREVPIPIATATTIQSQAGFTSLPRCWQVFVCFSETDWELQSLYGGQIPLGTPVPWTLDCPTCTGTNKFFNTTFGGFLAENNNPAFWPFIPEAQFDSWWYIGNPVYSPLVSGITWTPSLPVSPALAWNAGGAFYEASSVGSVIGGFWSPPSLQGKPDAENKVLIGQFTTDGIFEGTINLQFRQLQPDNTPVNPIVLEQAIGVQITNNPLIFEEDCPQLFLPLDLLSFDVAASDDRVNLMFNTLNEDQVESYTIERSMDMQTWSKVAQLPAKGGYNIEEEYFAVDYQPESGVNYYRLSETTVNGDNKALETRSVLFNRSKFEVYPNPSSDRIWFKGDVSDVRSIRFIDMTGKVVLDQVSGTEPIRELDVQHLSRGMYLIEFVYVNGDFYRTKLEIN
ncbi:MAG: hypothetical protein RL226_2320 [Bacteroidota bacterium]|jgi:hypothetical protein